MSALLCPSRIERVDLYARGAIVTRAVELPAALESGPVELAIEGVTALAELGSGRASLEGERDVVAVRGRVVLPEVHAVSGEALERVARLRLSLQDLRGAIDEANYRRSRLAELSIDPGLARRVSPIPADARIADALAIDALASEELARLDAKIASLRADFESQRRELERAEREASLATAASRDGTVKPRVTFAVSLSKGGAVTLLRVSYAVMAARWWPTYAARVTTADLGSKVALSLDAFVAQDTGEDWERVKLTLSTADLLTDARLPELPSLRLGRAQRPPKRGYRAAPLGLDEMFGAFDRAQRDRRPVPRAAPQPAPWQAPPPHEAPVDTLLAEELEAGMLDEDESTSAITRSRGDAPPPPAANPMPALSKARSFGAPASMSGPVGGYGAAPPLGAAIAAPQGMPMKRMAMAPGRGGGGRSESAHDEGAAGGELAQATEIEPGDLWLDFDGLSLADPIAEASGRGKLRRAPPIGREVATRAQSRIEGLRAPHALMLDPAADRGQFDHGFDAEGFADVRSDAEPHRVSVTSGGGLGAMRFLTVPREGPEVYREIELENPLGVPILGGPMDVFVDNALLATTRARPIDRGGRLQIGLGVEERIKVARKVEVAESSAGLLGGSTAVEHAVTIDLTSSLGLKALVDVLERLPVTDDKDLEIKPGKMRPEPEPYAQDDRGAHVRKGLRFRVELTPGGKAKVELGYRLVFAAKNEVVGGNRRD